MSFHVGEKGYIGIVGKVLADGVDVPDRTGVGSRAVFDINWVVDGDTFPFSTIRPAGLRLAFEEFWFFLNGRTQTKELEEKGVHFWKGNTTREFLDSRGLHDPKYPEGDMGEAYGSQLRDYGFSTIDDCMIDLSVDQLQSTYDILTSDKYSRRVYNTMWNPNESHLMALTPCWHSHQFVVLPNKDGEDELHLKVINRSCDIVFGFSFAVQQYRLYQMAMAKLCGFKLGKMSCSMSQVHIYNNQFDYALELINRDFGTPGTVDINKDLNSLEDLLTLKWEDIIVEGLEVNKTTFKTPRPNMAV